MRLIPALIQELLKFLGRGLKGRPRVGIGLKWGLLSTVKVLRRSLSQTKNIYSTFAKIYNNLKPVVKCKTQLIQKQVHFP